MIGSRIFLCHLRVQCAVFRNGGILTETEAVPVWNVAAFMLMNHDFTTLHRFIIITLDFDADVGIFGLI